MKIRERYKKAFLGLIIIGTIIGVAFTITWLLSSESLYLNFCTLFTIASVWFLVILVITILIKKLEIYSENEYDTFNELADIIGSGIALFTILVSSFWKKDIDKEGMFLITVICLSVLKLSVSILNFIKNKKTN